MNLTKTMTAKEAAALLAKARSANIVYVSKDLKPDVKTRLVRQFCADAERLARTKSVVLVSFPDD